MPTLRVLNRHGDDRISWSAERLAQGDPEAEAAVREAERLFARERSRGAVAFRIRQGAVAERLETLDPLADETVLIPPMVGG
jgi:transcription elongation GreA/GreB family factor